VDTVIDVPHVSEDLILVKKKFTKLANEKTKKLESIPNPIQQYLYIFIITFISVFFISYL